MINLFAATVTFGILISGAILFVFADEIEQTLKRLLHWGETK